MCVSRTNSGPYYLHIFIQSEIHLLPEAGGFHTLRNFITIESLKRDCTDHTDIAGFQLCLYTGFAVCHHKSFNEFFRSIGDTVMSR